MEAKETRLLKFINDAPQFIIPIYQRNYSWTRAQCLQLWADIMQVGESDAIPTHFIGSIVYIEEKLGTVSLKSPLLVIDGQQRLATVTLLLAALREVIGETELVDGFNDAKIAGYYLFNPLESGDRKYKLLLSEADRESLLHILGGPEPEKPSSAIEDNFRFFQEKIRDCADLKSLCVGLQKLTVVDIALGRGQDNPQRIFESMNSTGMDLSQADLIRNFLLMDLPPEEQTELYKKYWRPMELDFGQKAYQDYFDGFVRHYLSMKNREIPRLDRIYAEFKVFMQEFMAKGGSLESFMANLRKFAKYYCNMFLRKESDAALLDAFGDLWELKANVAYPMLLEWYDDYVNNVWSKEEFLEAMRLVESYLFRRTVCGIATNSLNKTFLIFNKAIGKDKYLENVKNTFALMPSYKRFPSDSEFSREILARNMYTTRPSYWTRKLENYGRKEHVQTNEYTIEHIMPQNDNLSDEWQLELGADWKRVHEQYLHRLGNLTLTKYNSEFGDKPFAVKQNTKNGYKESPLHLNSGLGSETKWDEEAIKRRGRRLADLALKVWPHHCATLQMRRTKFPKASSYSIDDHPFLQNKPTSDLFEALRTSVLALDPVVNEEFLKLYVAYKAETNFVDVIPLAKSLHLILNMKFNDLNDPKGLCKDASEISHWGNGDVDLYFSKMEELPYVMDLIRQSLQSQIGDD